MLSKTGWYLHKYGKYVEHCWNEIPIHFPHAKIDECIVMPNHIHGIIQLRESGNEDVMVQIGGIYNPVGVQNFELLQNIEPIREDSQQWNDSKQIDFQHIIPRWFDFPGSENWCYQIISRA
jgi:hypothetical protein